MAQLLDNCPIGEIVAFGSAGNERIGVVVGCIQHFAQGDCLIVRTPTAILKEQMGDLVPLKYGYRSATAEELTMHKLAVLHKATESVDAAVPQPA
jgi:hypothetical protein